MPLFLIERDCSGWDDAELDASSIRAQICAGWYDGMTWIRSYYDDSTQQSYCLCEAASKEDIERHARFAGLPCGDISAVRILEPQDLDGVPDGELDKQARRVGPPPPDVSARLASAAR